MIKCAVGCGSGSGPRTTTTTTTAAVLLADDGHVNLFPEARDAELDLALGGVGRRTKTPSSLPDVPLGGDEAARRRSGDVPFYMRHGGGGGEYVDTGGSSFRLGDNARRWKGGGDASSPSRQRT